MGRETIKTFAGPNQCVKSSSNSIPNENVESLSTYGDIEKDVEDRIVVEEDENEEVSNYFCMYSFLHVKLKFLKIKFIFK